MSVINKMLRDLDQRNAPPLEPALAAGTRLSALQQRQGEAADGRAPGRWCGGASLVVLLVGAIAVGWYGLHAGFVRTGVQAALAPASPERPEVTLAKVFAQPPAALVASGAVTGVEKRLLMEAAPPKDATGLKWAASVRKHSADSAPTTLRAESPPPGASSGRPAATGPATQSAATSAIPAASSVVALPPPSVGLPALALAEQRQHHAIRDVLTQAQSLYGDDAADAAIQLLRDALLTAQSAHPPAPVPAQLQLLREWVRMELTQGHPAAVLGGLRQQEPLMSGQADLWAVRANAAQRLGQHQDALQSYGMALQSRPSEPRWLLGRAVSHAALGELGQASELAQKARAMAPVSKEVLGYLRQQGVTLVEVP